MVVAEIVRSKCPEAQIGGEEFGPRFGVAGTNTIERYYDAFGRDAGYALNSVRQSTLVYDPSTGRLATMRIPSIEDFNHHSPTPTLNSNSFTWNYLDGSDLKYSLAYPNGLTASWTYSNRGELLEVNNASPTGTISRYAYTYDAAGRRVACAKSGTAFEQSDSVNYGYNTRSELTSATAAVDSAYRYGYNFDDLICTEIHAYAKQHMRSPGLEEERIKEFALKSISDGCDFINKGGEAENGFRDELINRINDKYKNCVNGF